MNAWHSERNWAIATFVLCVALNLGLSSFGWDHNLIEGHEFRQTQTALTARAIQQEGWTMAYPLPLFGPPWSAPMEFPFYQWCVAKVSSLTRHPLESTGRAVSIVFLYLCLPAIFLLLEYLSVPTDRRWLLLGLVLITPVYLYYSRSFMIESTALCAATWFLYAFCRSVLSRRTIWIFLAILLGIAAALSKATTFAVFLVPAAWFVLTELRRSFQNQPGRSFWPIVGTSLLIVGVSVGAGLWWVYFADRVKSSNPLSSFLVSNRLHDWNYGPLAERFELSFWANIGRISTHSVLQQAHLIFFICFVLLLGRAYRVRILGLLGCYLAGPLAFANLYGIHDYYHYATGIFLLAAMLLVWCGILELPYGSRAGKWAIITIGLAVQITGYLDSYYQLQIRGNIPPPEIARVLAATTAPDDVVVIYGYEWNPLIAYYSGRKVVMVAGENVRDATAQEDVFNRIESGKIAAVIVRGDLRLDRDFVRKLTAKFKLEPKPLLASDDTDFFLAERLIAPAVPVIKVLIPSGFVLNAPPDADVDGVKLWRFTSAEGAAAAAKAGFAPIPSEYLTPYGIVASEVDGGMVLNAHAPTNITIRIPPHATRIQGEFGLSSATYTGKQATDGVSFRVELVLDDGTRRELFSSFLKPATNLTDRGRKHFDVALPDSGPNALIMLHTDPGPARNNSFDWAYWAAVRMR